MQIDKLAQTLKQTPEGLIALLEAHGVSGKKASDELSQAEREILLKALKATKSLSSKKSSTLKLSSKSSVAVTKTIGTNPQAKKTSKLSINRKASAPLKSQAFQKPATLSPTNTGDTSSSSSEKLREELMQQKFAHQMQAKEVSEIKSAELAKTVQENRNSPKVKTTKTLGVKKESSATPPPPPSKLSKTAAPVLKRQSQKDKDREKQKERFRLLHQDPEERFLEEREKKIKSEHGFVKPTTEVVYEVKIPETITVVELAKKMALKASKVVECLMNQGMPATANQSLSQDIAAIAVEALGHKPVLEDLVSEEDLVFEKNTHQIKPRCPVVTIMGHVDHGKTTLLDAIRSSKVTAGEFGGITQHIGAYQVVEGNNTITFLDTPGHAAFSAMRARGANVTDIVVLVVSADDSVMPQTIEALQHAQAAKVPVIVAVNKMDKPDAKPEKVTQDLVQHGVIPEAWGGDTMFVEISALQNKGIDKLLEAINLQAELLDLKAPFGGQVRGSVLESRMDKGRGPVITVLITEGVLKKGDLVVSGMHSGKVKMLLNDSGQVVKEAVPSQPVEVLGLSGVPEVGDDLACIDDERKVKEIISIRQRKDRDKRLKRMQQSKIDSFLERMGQDESKDAEIYHLLVKGDVKGSVDAIVNELTKLSTPEVKLSVVGSGVGGINETDVHLAQSTNASVVGFNVRADAKAKRLMEIEGINFKYYNVIYELIDNIKSAMSGLLKDEFKDEIIGIAEVRDVFRSSKFGDIAGCLVIEGTVRRSHPIRVLRNNVVVFEGALESLRRVKNDVNEVKSGTECGIGVKDYNGIEVGDNIEVYERIKVERSL